MQYENLTDKMHDFETKIHGVLNAVVMIKDNLGKDKEFCEEALKLAARDRDEIFTQWIELKKMISSHKTKDVAK